ncbi:975_t:CDS:2, partial [Cetraspora pellucida]
NKAELIKHLAETGEHNQNHMQETKTHSIDTLVEEPSAQTNELSLVTESILSPTSGTSSDEETSEERPNKRQKNMKVKEMEIRKLLKEIKYLRKNVNNITERVKESSVRAKIRDNWPDKKFEKLRDQYKYDTLRQISQNLNIALNSASGKEVIKHIESKNKGLTEYDKVINKARQAAASKRRDKWKYTSNEPFFREASGHTRPRYYESSSYDRRFNRYGKVNYYGEPKFYQKTNYYEGHRKISESRTDHDQHMREKGKNRKLTCYNCRGIGHYSNGCPPQKLTGLQSRKETLMTVTHKGTHHTPETSANYTQDTSRTVIGQLNKPKNTTVPKRVTATSSTRRSMTISDVKRTRGMDKEGTNSVVERKGNCNSKEGFETTRLPNRSESDFSTSETRAKKVEVNNRPKKAEQDSTREKISFRGFEHLHSYNGKKLEVITINLKDGYHHLLMTEQAQQLLDFKFEEI